MHKKILLFALLLCTTTMFAQQEEETLFRKSHVRGGFGGPIFSWSNANNKTGYGAGGGGGVVFDRFFIGAFGMGETFDAVRVGREQLTLGYSGLWLGYTIPSHKLFHLYTSMKVAGGGIGTTNFEDDWNFDDNFRDVALVLVPEAGIELNVARWMRLSGSLGYRYVGGFSGWDTYGKNDLNALTYNITMRFGWFGGKKANKPGSPAPPQK